MAVDDGRPADAGPVHAHEHHVRVQRTARYFTLGPLDAAPRELWIVLHGYGQLARRFLRAFAALDDGTRLIVAPEALNRFYLVAADRGSVPAPERPVGATWMTREDRDTEINDYVELLDAVLAEVGARVDGGLDAIPRLIVLGFSQGTATAGRWLASGRVPARQLVLWGGGLAPEIELGASGPWLRAIPITLVAGDADEYATPAVVGAELERLREAGIDVRRVEFAGGHGIERGTLARLADAMRRE